MAISSQQFKQLRIGIIGLGNVGLAIGRGLQLADHKEQTIGCDRNFDKREAFTQTTGIRACEDWRQAAEFADLILVCLRHSQVLPFLEQLRSINTRPKAVISLAAVVSAADMKEALAPLPVPVIRAITNINVASRNGLTMVLREPGSSTPEVCALAIDLFQSLGEVIITDSERDLDRLSVLTGCGPAATAIFLEALCEFGIKAGFDAAVAKDVALQCVTASIKTLQHVNSDLSAFKYSVAAPGGIVDKLLGAPESQQIESNVVEWFDYILRRIEGSA